uniref:Growth factor receptor-bound protein 10 n=1 Tax=Sipha flava TaxID=143950 RepID=A0A2S2Q1S9_9HEMI
MLKYRIRASKISVLSEKRFDLTNKEIKVYNIDGTYQSVLVTPELSSEELCSQLKKNILSDCFDWSIVELWKDEGIERTLENHESVLMCYEQMKHENRTLELRISNKMFDMYKHPEVNFIVTICYV